MSATLNGAKWWSGRARYLEHQRRHMDAPEIARLNETAGAMRDSLRKADAEIARLRDVVIRKDGAIAILEGSLDAQAEVSNARFDENIRLRAHLAAAGIALDELTKPR